MKISTKEGLQTVSISLDIFFSNNETGKGYIKDLYPKLQALLSGGYKESYGVPLTFFEEFKIDSEKTTIQGTEDDHITANFHIEQNFEFYPGQHFDDDPYDCVDPEPIDSLTKKDFVKFAENLLKNIIDEKEMEHLFVDAYDFDEFLDYDPYGYDERE